jgi:hypothetical protein
MPKIGQKPKNAQNGKNGHFQENAKNGPFSGYAQNGPFLTPPPKGPISAPAGCESQGTHYMSSPV